MERCLDADPGGSQISGYISRETAETGLRSGSFAKSRRAGESVSSSITRRSDKLRR